MQEVFLLTNGEIHKYPYILLNKYGNMMVYFFTHTRTHTHIYIILGENPRSRTIYIYIYILLTQTTEIATQIFTLRVFGVV